MRAFGWAADNAGCYHYRISEPLNALGADGWNVDHGTRFTGMPDGRVRPDDPRLTGFAKQAAAELDVIIAQRTAQPGPTEFWRLLNKAGAFTVFEIDDDLFNIDSSNVHGFEFFNRPNIRGNLIINIGDASRVTVSTEPLADRMLQYNGDVRICPNAVPDWLLEIWPVRKNNGKVTIGWGGSPTHEMDFYQVEKPLRQLFRHRDDIEFHCIGSNYADWMGIPQDSCRFTPWVQSVPMFYRAIDYDIAIAPLRPHIFNRSKSYIKALECAALGIPVVASNIYPYTNFIKHGVTGYLVRYEHEWGTYLRRLIEDPQERAEMGANARKLAAGYTMSAMLPTWREALTP